MSWKKFYYYFRTRKKICGRESFKTRILYEVLSKREFKSLKGGITVVCVIYLIKRALKAVLIRKENRPNHNSTNLEPWVSVDGK